jgi:hypothetical protein
MALLRFVVKALGLVSFTGGLGTGLLAALLIGLVAFGVNLVLIVPLAGALVSGALLGSLGGPLGVRLAVFAVQTVFLAIALWVVAALLPGLALVGFWSTMGPEVL